MIDPDGLLRHAEQLAGTGGGRPTDADLRRGVSAAYYAVFHDLTEHVASHLIGSCPLEIQNEMRRSWLHNELARLSDREPTRFTLLRLQSSNPARNDGREGETIWMAS